MSPFGEGVFRKVFHFMGDYRGLALRKAKVGEETCVIVKDETGKTVRIWFRVTRNEWLSHENQWVYGKVLDMPDKRYYQVELRFNGKSPDTDTVEVFLQAPPVGFKKPRR